MNEYRKEIMRQVYLTILPARKFKTNCFSAQFVTALDRSTASYNALLPSVLRYRPQKRGAPVRGLCGQLHRRPLCPGRREAS